MKKIYFVLVALVVLLSACASNSASLEGEWTLISYGDASNPTVALPDVQASLTFGADGRLSGNVGCNQIGASYTINGNEVNIESPFATKKYCEGMMEQEDAILKILSQQTLNFELSGTQLTLTSQDGSSVIVLERK